MDMDKIDMLLKLVELKAESGCFERFDQKDFLGDD